MQVVTIVKTEWKRDDIETVKILTKLSLKVADLEREVYKQKKLLEPTEPYVSGISPARPGDFDTDFEMKQREILEHADD